jgi:molybdate transport system substrate-binding protein
MRRMLAIVIPLAALLAVAVWLLVPANREQSGPLVLAPSSLQESLKAAADAWQAQGHSPPVLSFAGTPTLARQVEAGAPADLFISADEQWMDELARKGRIKPGTRATFLGNSLVLVEPAKGRTQLTLESSEALAAALGSGKLAMADPETVPAGRYGRQALISLGAWPQVERRVVGTENVRLAAALVGTGEARFGVVYATDAEADARLRILATFPQSSHAPIAYPLALLKTSRNPDAEAFRRFLLSPQAAAIFERFGFTAGTQR